MINMKPNNVCQRIANIVCSILLDESKMIIDRLSYMAGKTKERKKNSRLELVFFRNGGAICAIFTMIVILLDQLKSEHAVDIFQSVRALQRQRPAMITSFVCRNRTACSSRRLSLSLFSRFTMNISTKPLANFSKNHSISLRIAHLSR